MEYDFTVTGEDLVDVVLHDERSILVHAMADAVGSRPPRGAPQDGPSTFWIDRTSEQLRARLEDHQTQPFASGNVTYLQLVDGLVEVRYDYDAPDDPYVDRVDPYELLALLDAWRERVLALSPDADRRIPPRREAIEVPPRDA